MKRSYIILFLIVIVGSFLRLWQLGHIPIAPNWDEASLGYNAYSLLLTHKDEYGRLFPIALQSFDDYKPALYAYLSIPFIKLFGLNIFAVRLASAIFGIIAVFATYFMTDEIFSNKKLALLTSFLISISPWHITFSRVAYEANIGLTLNILSILFLFKSFKKGKYLPLSIIFASIALYSYQAERLFIPLIFLSVLIIFRENFRKINRKYIGLSIILGLLISAPFLISVARDPSTLSRAKEASILSAPQPLVNLDLAKRNLVDSENHDVFGKLFDNRRVIYAKDVVNHYLSHFDINWLFIEGDSTNPLNLPLRKQTIGMGNLYLVELPFFILGLFLMFSSRFDTKNKKFILLWLILVPIPAAITWDTPSSIRTLAFLPILQAITAIGILGFFDRIKGNYKFLILTPIALFAIFNFIYFIDQYFVQYNFFAPKYWQYGYDQIVPESETLKSNYEKVVVSNQVPLDQSYIFFLFNLKYSPQDYQLVGNNLGTYGVDHHFDKYSFVFRNWGVENLQNKTLYVLNAQEWGSVDKRKVNLIKEVNYPNGDLLAVFFDKK